FFRMDFPPFVIVYHKRTKSPIHAEPKHYLLQSGYIVIVGVEDKHPLVTGSGSLWYFYSKGNTCQHERHQANNKKAYGVFNNLVH
ncbi:MAG: hypothetical protein KKD78_07370, partial [Proteobacteria bacterium]|nr:hypothetical protein [Pseudomonadota bacterium]